MKPKFSTLIILTVAAIAILTPFALSAWYVPLLRDNAFEWHQLVKGNLYKQITGYTALAFVFVEMLLTARKRSRGWKIKLNLPGSVPFWRSLHIFAGVGLLGLVLVHTIGATGFNFNAVFLWVFFGVTLTALVGVVAETGILESPRKYFGWALVRGKEVTKVNSGISKGPLIRKMRGIWLTAHIVLVSVFFVMLGFHIFLAYYYQ